MIRFISSSFCILLVAHTSLPSFLIAADKNSDVVIRPEGAGGAREYFSSQPNANVQVPINIWGEVSSPGIHYVPVGSTLRRSISGAGGPSGIAALPDILRIRNGKEKYIDVLEDGDREKVEANDTYFVERSFLKGDLPPVLGVVSTILGIISVTIALSNK